MGRGLLLTLVMNWFFFWGFCAWEYTEGRAKAGGLRPRGTPKDWIYRCDPVIMMKPLKPFAFWPGHNSKNFRFLTFQFQTRSSWNFSSPFTGSLYHRDPVIMIKNPKTSTVWPVHYGKIFVFQGFIFLTRSQWKNRLKPFAFRLGHNSKNLALKHFRSDPVIV